MTHDISELIAGIRAWQAADAAYREVHPKYWGTENEDERKLYQYARINLEHASHAVCGNFMAVGDTLAAFVALADHCEALEAALVERRAVLQKRLDKPMPEIGTQAFGENFACELWMNWIDALLGEPTASEGDA